MNYSQTYNENAKTGIVTLSFSADSMCSFESIYGQQDQPIHLKDRSEKIKLYPGDDHTIWNQNNQYCRIPDWMYGEFEYLTINEKHIIYRDHSSFKTYTMECVHLRDDLMTSDNQQSSKILTFSRTQCGMFSLSNEKQKSICFNFHPHHYF